MYIDVHTEEPEMISSFDDKYFSNRIYKCLSNDIKALLLDSVSGEKELLTLPINDFMDVTWSKSS